ncbi:MAG: tetratricopeptide repeat protein [Alphaproteobacteria bacterium]
MPFVRLIAIYIIVGLAIFAFFKRDAVMALISGPEAEVTMAAEPVETPMVEDASEPEITTPVVESAPEPVFAPAETATITTAPAAPVASMESRWADARQAFWVGDKDKAEELYKALAADFRDEVGIVGELGNLYYNTGRRAEAANQYHSVGLIALKNGDTMQVRSMIGILQSIAPDLAADLKTRQDQ